MIAKRAHTKSRRGCKTCKTRKVKCDEKYPLCGNCARRFDGLSSCNFPSDAGIGSGTTSGNGSLSTPTHGASPVRLSKSPSTRSSSTATFAGNSRSSSTTNAAVTSDGPRANAAIPAAISIVPSMPFVCPLPSIPAQTSFSIIDSDRFTSRGMQLRLFHHYITSTCYHIGGDYSDPEVRDVWKVKCPQWAFEHEFLLDTLLGTTALHLFCTDPIGRADMRAVALYWNSSGASKHREALSQVTEANAGPLLAMSMLVHMQSRATSALSAPGEPYQLPLELFYLQRGMLATLRAVMPFVENTVLRQKIFTLDGMLYERGVDLNELGWLTGEARQDADMMLREIDMKAEAAEKESLRAGLRYLLAIQFGLKAGEPKTNTRRRIGAMATLVPRGYVDLLEKKEVISMALLARYFAFTKVMDDEWWVRGTPERELEGISKLMPGEKSWLLDFPRWYLRQYLSRRNSDSDKSNDDPIDL